MRVDLRPQRAELGVAREDLELELLALRRAEGLEREQHVVHRQRQQEQQHAGREEERDLGAEAADDRRSSGIDSSVASHASFSASHSAAPTHAATIDAVSTRGTLLVASGVARQTYHADRQTNA